MKDVDRMSERELRAEVRMWREPRKIGLVDKNGVEVREGDLVDFDEREWGGPFEPEVIPKLEEFVKEWPLCGGASDFADWRAVIKRGE